MATPCRAGFMHVPTAFWKSRTHLYTRRSTDSNAPATSPLNGACRRTIAERGITRLPRQESDTCRPRKARGVRMSPQCPEFWSRRDPDTISQTTLSSPVATSRQIRADVDEELAFHL